MRALLVGLSLLSGLATLGSLTAAEQNHAYFEVEGTASDFHFYRDWRSYYWREDFTFVLRDDAGKSWRVISREPTPWNNLRFGTTFTGLQVDWAKQPRVKVIGVQAIDRTPEDFHDLKLDPQTTATAFIVRVKSTGGTWSDYFVNNWFHRWGADADRKVLAHFATDDPNYTVYGYLQGIAAPFDKAGQQRVEQAANDYSGIIYHGRVVKADNDVGYEVRLLHLVGRHKKTLNYDVFHGDPKLLVPLDQRPPK